MCMPMTRRAALPFLGALGLALTGCGGGGDDDNDAAQSFAAKAMVDNLADNVITQTYKNLNAAAASLLAAVQALQSAPTDEAAMNTAQEAWKSTRVPWESSEGYLFGPVTALSIDPAIDSWPLQTADLAVFLAANPNATQADVENAGDDLRGFHAIEYLLFGDGTTDNDKLASELTSAEINYLVALVLAFKAQTQKLESAWTTSFDGGPAFVSRVKNPGASNSSYTSYTAVVEQLIDGLIVIADETGNTKMSEPLGSSAAQADTSQVESQYSWNSLTDFHNNIQSIMNAYTGKLGFSWQTDTASASLNGLFAFVAYHNSTLASRVLTEIASAQKAIALIKGDGNNTSTVISGSAKPFRTQITDSTGRSLITAAIAACNTLKTSLESDVKPLVAKTTFSA